MFIPTLYYIIQAIDIFSSNMRNFRNIGTLAKSHTVYAIDLIGFGASDKPAGFSYTMEAWAQVYLFPT